MHNNHSSISNQGGLMKLSQLITTMPITIQCHDNPDADALASGYALYTYFKLQGCEVRLIYSGHFQIQKTNLVAMIELLNIPIEYVDTVKLDGLLITVDCQYGAGNVKKIEADDIAIIDHHQLEVTNIEKSEICSFLGSCSTLVWQMLLDAGFEVNEHPLIATALYYGLFTDTSQFAELYHPLDKDMRDHLHIDEDIIKRLKNSNLSLAEIEIAGLALIRYTYNEIYRFALIKARPCDPNILGLISDMMLQVDAVNTCVVYSELNTGIKLSVRSCVKEIKASELATYLTEEVGSGGGHIEKAGGFINFKLLGKKHPGLTSEAYFLNRLDSYHKNFDIIDASTYTMDTSDMCLYQKLAIPVGYAETAQFLPLHTPAIVRTLEGDIDIVTDENVYIMIGIDGEVYPIQKEKFERSYDRLPNGFTLEDARYFPSIKNKLTGETLLLKDHVKSCLARGQVQIYAKPLTRVTKVFTAWDKSKYMYGNIGDFIAMRSDDPQDIYVIRNDIFLKTYSKL